MLIARYDPFNNPVRRSTVYQWYEEAAQEVERDLSLDISHLERVSFAPKSHWWSILDTSAPDPHLRLTDPAPNPALFVSDLQDANKKYFFLSFCLFFGRYIYIFLQR